MNPDIEYDNEWVYVHVFAQHVDRHGRVIREVHVAAMEKLDAIKQRVMRLHPDLHTAAVEGAAAGMKSIMERPEDFN